MMARTKRSFIFLGLKGIYSTLEISGFDRRGRGSTKPRTLSQRVHLLTSQVYIGTRGERLMLLTNFFEFLQVMVANPYKNPANPGPQIVQRVLSKPIIVGVGPHSLIATRDVHSRSSLVGTQ